MQRSSSLFQSTLSSRRATEDFRRSDALDRISIHALLTESDLGQSGVPHRLQDISIHALLTESDTAGQVLTKTADDFNPRSPHGERPTVVLLPSATTEISIHALLTESDGAGPPVPVVVVISIHALLTESDRYAESCLICWRNFNPRSPHGERRDSDITALCNIQISIHALLTESDHPLHLGVRAHCLFQSTLSSRRATANTTKLALSFLSKVPILGWEKSKKAKGSANARGSFPVYGKNKVRIPWGDFECFRFAPIK